MNIPTPDKKELRNFGLVTGPITAVLFGVALPWLFSFNYPLWPWYIMVVLVGMALLTPLSLALVYLTWMKIGHVIGWINTRIILGIVFYVVFAPVALLLKILGKDAMRCKIDKQLKSYRIDSIEQNKNHMEKPF